MSQSPSSAIMTFTRRCARDKLDSAASCNGHCKNKSTLANTSANFTNQPHPLSSPSVQPTSLVTFQGAWGEGVGSEILTKIFFFSIYERCQDFLGHEKEEGFFGGVVKKALRDLLGMLQHVVISEVGIFLGIKYETLLTSICSNFLGYLSEHFNLSHLNLYTVEP